MTVTMSDHRDERAQAERCLIISADSHVGPSMREQLRPYCEREHLTVYDEFVDRVEAAGRVIHDLDLDTWDQSHLAVSKARSLVPGLQSPEARHQDMDADGIAADVLHHGGLNGQSVPFYRFGIGSKGIADYDHLEPLGVRIYNRWLADFVASAPERHVGIAQISVRDVGAAVDEVRWAREHGLTAVNLPAPRRDFPLYTDPVWEPFFAACADLEVTMVSHAGGGDIEDRFTGPGTSSMYLMEMPWMGRRGVWHLIFGGVFHRYPTLHFVLAEQFGDWVPYTLKEMDSAYRWAQNGSIRKALPLQPSEYFMRNVFVTASFMSNEEAVLGVQQGFTDRLLWGSDYPHPESSFPHSELSLRKAMRGMDRSVIDEYVCQNSASAYRLDVRALRAVADRIGPRYTSLANPYDAERPTDTPTSLAFRDYGHYV